MFEYEKVKLLKVSTEPIENIKSEAASVIAELKEESFNVDEIYFKIEEISTYLDGNQITYSQHYEGVFPKETLSEGYLYLVYSSEYYIEPIFIDPYVYEGLSKDSIDEIVMDFIEHGADIVSEYSYELDNYELDDEFDFEIDIEAEIKSEIIDKLYLESSHFYKFVDSGELVPGPLVDKEDKKFNNNNADYYFEPLIYKINNENLAVVSENNIKNKNVSLYSMNENYESFFIDDVDIENLINYFISNSYSIRDISYISDIQEEIINLINIEI